MIHGPQLLEHETPEIRSRLNTTPQLCEPVRLEFRTPTQATKGSQREASEYINCLQLPAPG
eukprot:11284107-Alexandrium_andersonii.AAC.1